MLQLDYVHQRAVIAFNLALGLRMIRGATGVPDVMAFKPFLQLTTDVTGPIA